MHGNRRVLPPQFEIDLEQDRAHIQLIVEVAELHLLENPDGRMVLSRMKEVVTRL